MRTKLLLFTLLRLSLFAQVSVVPASQSQDVVPAFDASGAITLPAARLKLDLTYPHGRKTQSELTVVYDPNTGHYLWHNAESDSSAPDNAGFYLAVIKKQRAVTFADPTGLVDFIFGSSPFVKVWQGHVGNLDAAVAASIREIQQGLPAFERNGYHMDYKYIPVFGLLHGFNPKLPSDYKPISREFICKPNNAFCPNDNNTIASVGKQGADWRLVLRNRWDEEVILDQNFDLVSVQQLTQPKQ